MAMSPREFLNRLSRRERIILTGGAVFLIGMALWGVIGTIDWYYDRMETLDRLIQKKHQERVKLVQLQKEYLGLKDEIATLDKKIEKNKSNFSLLTHLESLAGQQGVRSKIAYMRPQPKLEIEGYEEVGVEIKIQGVTLGQTVKFLSAIEESKSLVNVKRVRLKTRYSEPQYMDAIILATTYEEKKQLIEK